MKDRWKILWISFFFCLVLAALFLFMGFSLKKIDLRNYGILKYEYYDTVDINQSPRTNGNYLVGLDHSFVQFPKGYIMHQFSFKTLTKDKSMIEIEGIFIGKLIYSELVNLYFTYGKKYTEFLFASVQEYFHEAIEQFSLNQIVSSRQSVDTYIRSYVKSNIQNQYSWIQTNLVNLGAIKTDLLVNSLKPDTQIEQNYLQQVNSALENQKKYNIYESGGFQLLNSLQKQHSDLFYNISQRLKLISDQLNGDADQTVAAMEFVVNSDFLPLLDNKIQIQISR